MHDDSSHDDPTETETVSPDANTVVEQVRELLFGDHRRASDVAMKSLEDRLAALAATLEARFGDLERRIEDLKSHTGAARDRHAETLGATLIELGERIRGMAGLHDDRSIS